LPGRKTARRKAAAKKTAKRAKAASVPASMRKLRALCLALPGATEQEAWGEPTFRVGGRMFAMHSGQHPGHGPERALLCKAPPGVQGMLVSADPGRFFVPRYVGHSGWIGIRLDGAVDWDVVADLVEESWRMTAPKRLAAARTRD
jgi:hypothetical protein